MKLSEILSKQKLISNEMQEMLKNNLYKYDYFLVSNVEENIKREILKNVDKKATWFNWVLAKGGGTSISWNNFATIKVENPDNWSWNNSYKDNDFFLNVWKEDDAPNWGDNFIYLQENEIIISQMVFSYLIKHKTNINKKCEITRQIKFEDNSDKLISNLIKEMDSIKQLTGLEIIDIIYMDLIKKIKNIKELLLKFNEFQSEIILESCVGKITLKPNGNDFLTIFIEPKYRASVFHKFINARFQKNCVPFNVN